MTDKEREPGALHIPGIGRASACLDRAIDMAKNAGSSMRSWTLLGGDMVYYGKFYPKEMREKLDRVLCGARPDLGLEDMRSHGALSYFDCVDRMIGFGGGAQGHKDLWEHTKKVVAQADARPVIRWAALFHDVGKVQTIVREGGKVSFHGHEAQSTRLFAHFAQTAGIFRPSEESRIRDIVYNLGRVESFEGKWTDSAVRRVMTDLGDCLDDVIALSSADITTGRDEKRRRILDSIEDFKRRIDAIRAADSAPRLPKGLGIVLSDELGIPRDRSLKLTMDRLESMLRAGEIPVDAVIADYVKIAREKIVGKD